MLTEVSLGAGLLVYAAADLMLVDRVHSLLAAGAIWFVADSVRERRRYLAGLAEQAAQRQEAAAEANRQAVRAERVRIARELHDVVAHSLGVVTVQAGVGRRIGAAAPAEALRALRAVEVTGRSALEELRRILGLLRDDEGPQPSLAPAPGIADLGELAQVVRAAGTPVSLAVTGDVAGLPPAAALTVYRIIQEALTNVVKHAGGAAAAVRVAAGPDGVRIAVTNDGQATGPGSAAGRAAAGRHGIVGMRERAAVFGGTLDAAPLAGGGFRVTAFLPVHGQPAAEPVAESRLLAGRPLRRPRTGWHEHRRGGGRRPGHRPGRVPDAHRGRTGPGRARRGGGRRRGGRGEPGDRAGRRAHGHPDAGAGRHRGDPADHRGRPPPRVLILTTFDLDDYVFGALRAGASGFMLKERPPEELLAAVRVIAAGEALLAPNVTRRLIAHFASQPDPLRPPPQALARLTAREREVLTLIAHGLSNTEIAGQLAMSVPTAKTHVSRILAKLGARDRAQLVVLAFQAGLVQAG